MRRRTRLRRCIPAAVPPHGKTNAEKAEDDAFRSFLALRRWLGFDASEISGTTLIRD